MLVISVIVVLVVILGARAIGRDILSHVFKSKPPFPDPVLSGVTAAAIGLIVLGFLLFGLVALHLVYRGLLWGIVAACALLAAPEVIRWAKAAPAFLKGGSWRNVWTLAAALYFLIAVALTSLPATMNDEMIYHLAVPKTLLAAHGGFPFHDNIYAFFPQLGEMFFLLGLGTAGEAAAKLFHVAAGFLLFLAVHRFALGLTDRKQARLAAAALLTVASVMAILSLAYVDLTFALFTFLAVISIREYFEGRNLGHALFAGLMLGGAVSVKYTGLQMTALVLCLLAITRLKQRDLPVARPAALIAAGAGLCALPWLVRNLLVTGWPMFPFPLPFFSLKPGFNWDPERAGLFLRFLQSFGASPDGGALADTLLAPFRVFFQGRFDSVRFYDGILGPVFLLVPLLVLSKKRRQGLGALLTFSLIFILYWSFSTRQIRFLLPLIPFLCVALAYACRAWKKAWLTGLVALLLLFNMGIGLKELAKRAPWDLWSGKMTRRSYLERQVPVLAFYAEAAARLGSGSKLYLIHMRNYGYYLDAPWTGDFVFERYRLESLLEGGAAVPEIAAFFSSVGATHIMVNRAPLDDPRLGLSPDARTRVSDFLARACEPVLDKGSYALFKLTSPLL